LTVLVWFRQDLRTIDNPALHYAASKGMILPVYIYDDANSDDRAPGGASKWWLHHSLTQLDKKLNGNLLILRGDPLSILPALMAELNIDTIVWNRCYEPWQISRDQKLKGQLSEQGRHAHSFNGSLLWEPWEVLKKDGTPYKVFTPYYRRGCLNRPSPRLPLPRPERIRSLKINEKTLAGKDLEVLNTEVNSIDDLSLLPQINWHHGIQQTWTPGQDGAAIRLQTFLRGPVTDYKDDRNIPGTAGTSMLSPHIHFGEISPNQIWYAALNAEESTSEQDGLDCFLSELGWREFSYYLLFHFPSLPQENFQKKFDHFSWRKDNKALKAWQQGQTGIPIVDAGMRELWQTGTMHNRVRMIVGSFLVKNLLIHWHNGETWFWDCLVDADLASNAASWQWIAGSGADAAPYFRIFNPVSQGERFDPEGTYVKRYCPELSGLPKKFIHKPWDADTSILNAASLTLGKDYPKPIVDLKLSRQRALDAFSELKNSA